ncbi:MAG: 4'-phosphopantetheinyl transferase family protein, partial [Pyrinomonadaceae bacterium]
QRRAFRRYCALLADSSQKDLSQVDFRETVNGRPYLSDREDIWFSFSACSSGCLGAWSMSHAVGIDIEDRMQEIEALELAKAYFSKPEATAVATLEEGRAVPTILKYWSLKEAALKSIGEGLPFGLDTFEFRLDPQVSVAKAPGEPSSFTAFAVSAPNSVAALVIRDITYELSLTQQHVGIQSFRGL